MIMKKRGLGRGLDVLIKSPAVESGHGAQTVNLPADSLKPNAHQPRQHFDSAALEELAGSIRAQGLIQPVLVRPMPGGTYEIVAGERRWRACVLAGLTEIQCIVRAMDDYESMTIALIENLQREDLNPMEEARACGQIRDHLGITQEELADRIGKSRPAVANCLRLLKLPEKAQSLLEKGVLSAGHGRALLALDDAAAMESLAQAAADKGLTVRALEDAIRRLREKRPHRPARAIPAEDIGGLVRALRDRFTISCSGTREKGKVVLSYASEEERERITRALEKISREDA